MFITGLHPVWWSSKLQQSWPHLHIQDIDPSDLKMTYKIIYELHKDTIIIYKYSYDIRIVAFEYEFPWISAQHCALQQQLIIEDQVHLAKHKPSVHKDSQNNKVMILWLESTITVCKLLQNYVSNKSYYYQCLQIQDFDAEFTVTLIHSVIPTHLSCSRYIFAGVLKSRIRPLHVILIMLLVRSAKVLSNIEFILDIISLIPSCVLEFWTFPLGSGLIASLELQSSSYLMMLRIKRSIYFVPSFPPKCRAASLFNLEQIILGSA